VRERDRYINYNEEKPVLLGEIAVLRDQVCSILIGNCFCCGS
jgi:hypothetical protein